MLFLQIFNYLGDFWCKQVYYYQSEKEKLLKGAYMVSLYPKAYKGILNDHELEKSFKGKISGKTKVGFYAAFKQPMYKVDENVNVIEE